ncbi:PREDICTED: protein SCAR2 isoform X3 [Ipomoea nil]|uniref:protein SCAR2 isoform X3 n=1 Tax=Ipomoea nil TaxID=35883 RepID=UPI0009017889|nr:PREDICTED: protein SCAR2 isoform X3 [Ipomoea nil]
MPLSRYQIRNEFSLADPELYRAADKDDPEALLEGVAMTGLVGVLRQLGDLAEFAAEIFHDLHEEVMSTAARGHSLTIRVQQLEAEMPSIEKAFLSQTSHSSFFYNSGTDWHPNLRMDQNMVTQGDLPRFVMDSYEECRGPPRLFLLDKFDIAGAGACQKRYTDPSFFKEAASSFEMTNADFQREKRTRKAKQKKGSRWRNGETPEVLPTSHAKLHQLFLEEERIENGTNDSGRRVKLKRRLNGFPFDSKTGKSYMEKFLRTTSPEHVVHEVSVDSSPLKLPASSAYEIGLDYVETNATSADEETTHTKLSMSPSLSPPQSEENDAIKQPNDALNEAVTVIVPTFDKVSTGNEIIDGQDKREDSTNGYHSDDIVSEVENYVDAVASMDSELDTDSELRARIHSHFLNREKPLSTNHDQIQSQSSDSQSISNSTLSDDANSTSKKEVSSFSSGSPSTSVETAPLDGDTATINEIREIQMCYSPVDLQPNNEGVASAQPSEQVVFSETSIVAAEHLRQSYDLEPLSMSSLLDSALVPGITEAGTVMKEDALVKPTANEMLSTLDEGENYSTDVAETAANQHMNVFAPICSDAPGQMRDDLPPIVSAENQLLDDIHTVDLSMGKNITSSKYSDVPHDSIDDLPADDQNGDNSALDNLNLSNNMFTTSNPFAHQKRDESLSTENKFLDNIDGEVLDSVDNTNCLDNLSNHSTSRKDGHSPSSSSINYSTGEFDDGDQNISSGVSVRLPNMLEASSEEECVKHDLLVAPEEENAEDDCLKISEDHSGSLNLPVVQTENKALDSASEIENTSVKFDETLVSEEEYTEDNCTANSDGGHIGPSNLSIIQTVPLDTRDVAYSQSRQVNLDEAPSMTNTEDKFQSVPGPDLIEMVTSSLSPCLDSTSEEPAGHVRVTQADRLNAEGAAASLGSSDECTGGASVSSLDIKQLQDDSNSSSGHCTLNGLQRENLFLKDDSKDSGALNEIGHHTVMYDLHEIAGYNHLESEVLTLDLDKTSSMQLPFEQSTLNVEETSSPRSSFKDVIGDASPLQSHPCAEQESELPRDQLDNEEPLDYGEKNLNLIPPLEQELSCQSDQAGLFGASSKYVMSNIPFQAPLPEDKCKDASSLLISQFAEHKAEIAHNQLHKEELLVGNGNAENTLLLPQLEQRQPSYHTELERSVNLSSIPVTSEVPIQCSFPKLLAQGNHDDASSLPTHDCLEENVKLTCNQIEKEQLVVEDENISEQLYKLEKIEAPDHVHQEGFIDASSKTMLNGLPCKPSVSKLLPHGNNGIGLFPRSDQINLEEMPPLPPLPPVQWRIGKFQRVQERDGAQNGTGSLPSFPSQIDQAVQPSEKSLPLPAVTNEDSTLVYEYGAAHYGSFTLQAPHRIIDENSKENLNVPTGKQPLDSSSQVIPVDKACTVALGTSSEELILPVKQTSETTEDTCLKRQELEKGLTNSEGNQTTNNRLGQLVKPEDSGPLDASQLSDKELTEPPHQVALVTSMEEAKIDKGSTSLEDNLVTDKELIQPEHQVAPEMSLKELKLDEDSSSSEVNLVTHDTMPSDKEPAPETSLNEQKLDKAHTISEENLVSHNTIPVNKELTPSEHQVAPEVNSKELESEKSSACLEENLVVDDALRLAMEMNFQKPLQAKSSLEEDIIWPAVEDGMVNGSRKMKLPRPRTPLIEAVAAHDKSKLRKVTDRVKPPVQKVDERDMLLEQIRNKSFNLKPASVTRPNIQAPQPNLRVAAILEKAKTIRQAFAGSDEEDDEDSWD